MILTFGPGRNGRNMVIRYLGVGKREMPRLPTKFVKEMLKNRFSRCHEHHRQKNARILSL